MIWVDFDELGRIGFSKFARGDAACKVRFLPLGGEVVVLAGEGAEVPDEPGGPVVWRGEAELRLLARLGREGGGPLRALQEVKRTFRAEARAYDSERLEHVSRVASAVGWSEGKMRAAWARWSEEVRSAYKEHRERALSWHPDRLVVAQYAVAMATNANAGTEGE